MTHQECEEFMIGKYELFAPPYQPVTYKDLEIMSNNVFSCSCLATGEWVRVTGTWDLNWYNGTTKKYEELNPTLRGGYRIDFSCMLDETGRRTHVSLPFEISKSSDYVWITVNDDLGISFKKVPPPKTHTGER